MADLMRNSMSRRTPKIRSQRKAVEVGPINNGRNILIVKMMNKENKRRFKLFEIKKNRGGGAGNGISY